MYISKCRPVTLRQIRTRASSIGFLYPYTLMISPIRCLTDAISQDNSSAQCRSFHLNLTALGALMATFAPKVRVYTPYVSWFRPSRQSAPNSFYIPVSLLMLSIFHGASIFNVLFILAMNYVLAKVTGECRSLLCRQRGYQRGLCCSWTSGMKDTRLRLYTQHSHSW